MKHPFNPPKRKLGINGPERSASSARSAGPELGGTASKKPKYGNKKVTHDNILFDSIKERDRYLFLKDQQSKGNIANLRTHVTYELIPHQTKTVHKTKQLKTKVKEWDEEKILFLAVKFTPDFVYEVNGKTIAEDVKGSKYVVSKDFPIRQKLLHYVHNIYCHIVTKATEPIKA